MYALFEINDEETVDKGEDSIIKTHTSIQSLSWMNKTNSFLANPNSSSASQESDQNLSEYAKSNDLKFKKYLNHQEGWLATGNSNFMVGCTFTTCLSEQQYDYLKTKEQSVNKPPQADKEAMPNDDSPTNPIETSDSVIEAAAAETTPPTSSNLTSSSLSNLNRTNFNLRGHKHDIKLVRWNEPYQKLASCDSKGLIYVWVKYEGRWSIELINDRGNCVSDFAWSHDGRMAVICYQDGFVLVGSVNGQRFWSHLYDLPQATITSATWTPNDAYVLFGLSNGNLMVVDEHGTVITRHNLKNDCILSLAYNTPKFFISDEVNASSLQNSRFRFCAAGNNNGVNNNGNHQFNNINVNIHEAGGSGSGLYNNNIQSNNNNSSENKTQASKNNKIDNSNYKLACLFKTKGLIYLLRSYDDLDPIFIETKLEGVKFEWSNCGNILAVGGYKQDTALSPDAITTTRSYIQFYNQHGNLLFQLIVPIIKNEKDLISNSIISQLEKLHAKKKQPTQSSSNQLFSALTWGHNDQRLFVACNSTLHILRVHKQIPSLSLLTQMCIKTRCTNAKDIESLCLTDNYQQKLKTHYQSTIKSVYPKLSKLRTFVCNSLPNNERLHCTLKRIKIGSKHDYYVLYLEYLGGFIPLLTARKSSKLKPDFVVFDPFLGVNKPLSRQVMRVNRSKTEEKYKVEEMNQKSSGYSSSEGASPLNASSVEAEEALIMKLKRLSTISVLRNEFSKKPKAMAKDQPREKLLRTSKKSSSKAKIKKISRSEGGSLWSGRSVSRNQRIQGRKGSDGKSMDKNNKYLVHITSNVWGTRFKFSGQNYLPNSIGHITYKTSLFHLQPRQMKIVLDDLSQSTSTEKTVAIPKTAITREQLANNNTNRLSAISRSSETPFSKTDSATKSISEPAVASRPAESTLNLNLKRQLNNLISITTSATLGAIPGLAKNTDSPKDCSCPSTKPSQSSFEKQKMCNDEIATVHGLVENKFSRNINGDFFEKFNLPILKLASSDIEIEDYVENNMITSSTSDVQDINGQDDRNDEEIYLLTSSSCSSLNHHHSIPTNSSINYNNNSINTTTPTNTTTSLTTTIYPKYHKKHSKFNLIDRFNRSTDLFFSSNNFFNFLLNRKVLANADYHKLEEKNDFNLLNKEVNNTTVVNNNNANSENLNIKHEINNADDTDVDPLIVESTEQKATSKLVVKRKMSQKKALPNKNQIVLKNKPPIWNETNQVYQLDFGGRVTQESAKNFQIEFEGKQVMQFGRIDPNAYTLDFEWPFTAIQAFSIALANITQRFK